MRWVENTEYRGRKYLQHNIQHLHICMIKEEMKNNSDEFKIRNLFLNTFIIKASFVYTEVWRGWSWTCPTPFKVKFLLNQFTFFWQDFSKNKKWKLSINLLFICIKNVNISQQKLYLIWECIAVEEDLWPGLPEWHNSRVSLWRWWLSFPAQDHHNSSNQGWVTLIFIYREHLHVIID